MSKKKREKNRSTSKNKNKQAEERYGAFLTADPVDRTTSVQIDHIFPKLTQDSCNHFETFEYKMDQIKAENLSIKR